MAVTHMAVGAVSATTARVKAKVSGTGTFRLAVSLNSGMTSPVFHGSTTASNSMVDLTATGLTANTEYWFRIEQGGVIQTAFTGHFKTFPVAGTQASYSFAVASCANGSLDPYPTAGPPHPHVSNSPVFDSIRLRNPLFFAHIGDAHYRNIETADTTAFRLAYDDWLGAPRQHELYRNVPQVYVWDDHDFGPNNSDSTSAGRAVSAATYRERIPSYTLPAGAGDNPIYHSFQVGRILFIVSDTRHQRSPNSTPDGPSKTMLGTAQKTWMRNLLENPPANSEALVWLNPTPWLLSAGDSWGGFATERAELGAMFEETGWSDRMICLNGDYHGLGIDTGGNNDWGGFPSAVLGSLDSLVSPGSGSAAWDLSQSSPGSRRYGVIGVDDQGDWIDLTITGYADDFLWNAYTYRVWLVTPPTQDPQGYNQIGYLTPGGGFSVEGWAWSDEAVGTSRCLFAQNDQWKPEQSQIDLHRSNLGGIRLRLWDKANTEVANLLLSDVDFGDGTWHHFAVSLKSDKRTLQVFFDGEVVGEDQLDAALTWNPGMFAFGGKHFSVGAVYQNFWVGRLAYLGWKNSYVDAASIKEHYRAGAGALVFAGDTEVERMNRVLDWAHVPPWKRYLDEPVSRLDGFGVTGANALQELQASGEATDGLVFANGRGDVVYQNRVRRRHRWSAAEFAEFLGTAVEDNLTPEMDQQNIYNDVTGQRPNSTLQIRRADGGSIKQYGRKTYTLSLPVQDPTELLSAVLWTLYKYTKARLRISRATVAAHSGEMLHKYAFGGVEVGDLITISDLPDAAPSPSIDLFVEALDLEASEDTWFLTFSLSPNFETRVLRLNAGCKLNEGWVIGH